MCKIKVIFNNKGKQNNGKYSKIKVCNYSHHCPVWYELSRALGGWVHSQHRLSLQMNSVNKQNYFKL